MKAPSRIKSLIALGAFVGFGSAFAGMTAEEAARLGKDLTPIGAERAGNKAGTIPEWTGGVTKPPAGFDPTKGYADPFASEKPLYTITAANMAQYKDQLAAGQMELLKRYPSYKINVYPTHRTGAFPQSVYDAAKAEGVGAALTGGGTGVTNTVRSTVPFPVPKAGVEVLWNHMMRFRGGNFIRYSAEFPVQTSGSFTPLTRSEFVAQAAVLDKPEPNRMLYAMFMVTGPSSQAGEVDLLHSPQDQTKEPNLIWVYNAGQRRVLRAPDLCCDTPGQGSDGLRTTDDYGGFFGPTDRYDWKLAGKKEMIISYNNYRLNSKGLKYADMVRPTNLNSDLVRYELHRVWVVEATLKQGMRHAYAKRTFYFDEDSFEMAHADQYDGRGELWRVHETHLMQYYDVPMANNAGEVVYDLQARRYVVLGVTNQEKPMKFNLKQDLSFFSTDNLRRLAN
jgi:hypothetical protein